MLFRHKTLVLFFCDPICVLYCFHHNIHVFLRQLTAREQTAQLLSQPLCLLSTSCSVLIPRLSNKHIIAAHKVGDLNAECSSQFFRGIEAGAALSALVVLDHSGRYAGQFGKVVWWKCEAGHSYRAKITERTIEQKDCPQCEAEFQQALPQMLIMMYGAQNGVTVKSNSDSELGMPIAAFLPELHCAVDVAGTTVTEKREQGVKEHICQCNQLSYYIIKRSTDALQIVAEVKAMFARNHIYLRTDVNQDIKVLRERFYLWKSRSAHDQSK